VEEWPNDQRHTLDTEVEPRLTLNLLALLIQRASARAICALGGG